MTGRDMLWWEDWGLGMDAAQRSQLRWGLGTIAFFIICFDAVMLIAPDGLFNDISFLLLWAFFNVFIVAMVAIARFYKAI